MTNIHSNFYSQLEELKSIAEKSYSFFIDWDSVFAPSEEDLIKARDFLLKYAHGKVQIQSVGFLNDQIIDRREGLNQLAYSCRNISNLANHLKRVATKHQSKTAKILIEEKVDELFPPEETKTIDELWSKTYGLRDFYEGLKHWAEAKIPEEIKPLVEKCTELKEVKTND